MRKNGSLFQFQSAVAPFEKFTSICLSKYVWNRNDGSATSKPDWPPSPTIEFVHRTGLPSVVHVPLSCVPPWSTLTLNGLTDRLWNCSVVSPWLMPWSRVGTRESICLQRASRVALSPRESHSLETSANEPLERIKPPSFPSKNCSGFDG